MKILVIGDIHGEFSKLLYPLLAQERPDIVLSTGDFGFWPWRRQSPSGRKANPNEIFRGKRTAHHGMSQIHFCDGNHEDHAALRRLMAGEAIYRDRHWRVHPPAEPLAVPEGYQPQAHEVFPDTKIFFQARGSTLTLPDGRVILFAGGADSQDATERTRNFDWFAQEMLTDEDFARFPDTHVDIVISHTCPTVFSLGTLPLGPCQEKIKDPSRAILDRVWDKYRPSRWYFGHWHLSRTGNHRGCRWSGLNASLSPHFREKDWWITLPPAPPEEK